MVPLAPLSVSRRNWFELASLVSLPSKSCRSEGSNLMTTSTLLLCWRVRETRGDSEWRTSTWRRKTRTERTKGKREGRGRAEESWEEGGGPR